MHPNHHRTYQQEQSCFLAAPCGYWTTHEPDGCFCSSQWCNSWCKQEDLLPSGSPCNNSPSCFEGEQGPMESEWKSFCFFPLPSGLGICNLKKWRVLESFPPKSSSKRHNGNRTQLSLHITHLALLGHRSPTGNNWKQHSQNTWLPHTHKKISLPSELMVTFILQSSQQPKHFNPMMIWAWYALPLTALFDHHLPSAEI